MYSSPSAMALIIVVAVAVAIAAARNCVIEIGEVQTKPEIVASFAQMGGDLLIVTFKAIVAKVCIGILMINKYA
jgi:hypothetical protein